MRSIFIAVMVLFCLAAAECFATDSKLRVGAVLGLTGTAGDFGQELRQGMELCNSEDYEIWFEDSQGRPAVGLSAFKKLVAVRKIDIGVVSFSGVAQSVLPVAAAHRVPVIATLVSSRSATRGANNAFRFFTSGEQEAPIMARYLVRRRRLHRAAVLSLEDEYGASYRSSFVTEFEKHGASVVSMQEFSRESFEFRTALLKVRASRAEVLYVIGHDAHIIAVARQARELGLTSLLASNWILASPNVRRDNEALLEGVLLTSPSFYWSQGERQEVFRASFYDRHKVVPTAYSALGCDLMSLITEYYNNDLTSLVTSLKNLRDFEGVLGLLSGASDGSLEFALYPAVVESGKVRPLDATW